MFTHDLGTMRNLLHFFYVSFFINVFQHWSFFLVRKNLHSGHCSPLNCIFASLSVLHPSCFPSSSEHSNRQEFFTGSLSRLRSSFKSPDFIPAIVNVESLQETAPHFFADCDSASVIDFKVGGSSLGKNTSPPHCIWKASIFRIFSSSIFFTLQ